MHLCGQCHIPCATFRYRGLHLGPQRPAALCLVSPAQSPPSIKGLPTFTALVMSRNPPVLCRLSTFAVWQNHLPGLDQALSPFRTTGRILVVSLTMQFHCTESRLHTEAQACLHACLCECACAHTSMRTHTPMCMHPPPRPTHTEFTGLWESESSDLLHFLRRNDDRERDAFILFSSGSIARLFVRGERVAIGTFIHHVKYGATPIYFLDTSHLFNTN